MGLDVLVMPIWKFKAGDLSLPVQKLETDVFVIGLDGTLQKIDNRPPGVVRRWKARLSVKKLRREIERELGHAVEWNDAGDVVYREQAPCGFEGLRAYAKWLDHRDLLPTFGPPPQDNYYKHPAMLAKEGRPLTYPQLVNHSCHSGYLLPIELERVVYVEPHKIHAWTFKHSVGSSPRLHEELRRLSGVLGIEGGYVWQNDDPLAAIKTACTQLYEITRISCEKNLPVVFYG